MQSDEIAKIFKKTPSKSWQPKKTCVVVSGGERKEKTLRNICRNFLYEIFVKTRKKCTFFEKNSAYKVEG